MTAREFRGSAAWKRARRVALQSAYGCAICGGAFVVSAGCRHPRYPTVDHVIPLARLNLATAAGRAMAADQSSLRVVHNGCNASRGARDGNVQRAADRRAARSAFFAERARAARVTSREW